MRAGMRAAAEALNMEPRELKQQLKSGMSLDEIANAQGVDPSKVREAVSSAVKPLDQRQQKERFTARAGENLTYSVGTSSGAHVRLNMGSGVGQWLDTA
jgi:hypothetical protein